MIAIAGDDHVAKSSTAAHQSDHIFKACGLPVFFPSGVQDILDMGLHAFAMSRFSGVWSGMKTIQEVVESSSSVSVDPDRVKIILPEDFAMPPGGLHMRWPDAALDQEARLFDYKWYAALAYVRANKLNYNVVEGPNDRFGIIASGKAYNDTRQALSDLGLDDAHDAPTGHPAAQGQRGLAAGSDHHAQLRARACRKSWWSRRSARSSNTRSRKSSTTGAPTCGPTCWASSTNPMATPPAANGACPTPARTGCCAPRPT